MAFHQVVSSQDGKWWQIQFLHCCVILEKNIDDIPSSMLNNLMYSEQTLHCKSLEFIDTQSP